MPRPPQQRTYSQHKERWLGCTGCALSQNRTHVVLVRGTLPCDYLFIGEAPGQSEDVLGKPFIGPAGKLLDQIIGSALGSAFKLAFTNLVCCIPMNMELDRKMTEPPVEAIDACSSRLLELIEIARPTAIIAVGTLSDKHLRRFGVRVDASIIHPAAILRMDVSQKGLAIQRCEVALSELPPF